MSKVSITLDLSAVLGSEPIVEVDQAQYQFGAIVTATMSGGPGGAKDWLGVSPAEIPWSPGLPWAYVDPGATSKTWNFVLPSSGFWQVVLYMNDKVEPPEGVARSPVFEVLPMANRDPVWRNDELFFDSGNATWAHNLTFSVYDPDGDPLAFSIISGLDFDAMRAALVAAGKDPSLAEAFSLDPTTFELHYDGRDFGMAEGESVSLPSGVVLSADDGR